MKRKLMVIGIDSLDPVLLAKFWDRLPNIRRIANEGVLIKTESVFPPDSIPAWISVFTGQLPSTHGIIHSFDVFQSDWKNILAIDPSAFKERTFWQILSSHGYRSTVLFPQLCYPPWQINGVMVSRSLTHEVASVPDGVLTDREKEELRGFSGMHPGKKHLSSYYDNAVKVTLKEGEFALKMSESTDWDFFFVFFAWLDIVCHFFWRYMDESDPTYPGRNRYEDFIPSYYTLIDQIVGNLHDSNPDSSLMIIGDHGHGMRPPKTVNLNIPLRDNGLLHNKGRTGVKPLVQELLKRTLLNVVMKLELDDWMLRFSKKSIAASLSKDVYMSSSLISDSSTAKLSSFAGPKSYSHGGVDIAQSSMSSLEYEQTRDLIIAAFCSLKDPKTGEELVDWICRREEVLTHGTHVEDYPDVIFQLRNGYGTHWDISGPLIGVSYEHNLSSGGHKNTSVMILYGAGGFPNVDARTPRIIDICPTILEIFDISESQDIDGTSLLSMKAPYSESKEERPRSTQISKS